ncbi:MAG: hypothetical protein IJ867_03430 [Clostridia bacterium]|nr:hypothetical protein [Clostridia bacterium]MBR2289663.1 hypothetical protein [Clostridia bacterium]
MKSNEEYNTEVQEILSKYKSVRDKYKMLKTIFLLIMILSVIALLIVFAVPTINNRLLLIAIAFVFIIISELLNIVFGAKLYNIGRKVIEEVEQMDIKDEGVQEIMIEKVEDFFGI